MIKNFEQFVNESNENVIYPTHVTVENIYLVGKKISIPVGTVLSVIQKEGYADATVLRDDGTREHYHLSQYSMSSTKKLSKEDLEKPEIKKLVTVQRSKQYGLAENEIQSPTVKYKKPSFEMKEFYRAFKNHEELKQLLPREIDKAIFKVKGSGFEGEPSWLEKHSDPPSRDNHGTEELIEIAKEKDPRFIPFIHWCKELFDKGSMKKLTLDYILKNLKTKFKNHDWEEDPEFLTKCKAEYDKAVEVGLNSESLNATGLVKKYPEINISKAQFWATYAKDSIAYFDSIVKKGEELPCTQFLLHNGIYYTVGGRRRMFWHLYHNANPTLWIINL